MRPQTYKEKFKVLAKDDLNVAFQFEAVIKIKSRTLYKIGILFARRVAVFVCRFLPANEKTISPLRAPCLCGKLKFSFSGPFCKQASFCQPVVNLVGPGYQQKGTCNPSHVGQSAVHVSGQTSLEESET